MNAYRPNIWIWSGVAALLALPWIAMRFTHDVAWTGSDFLAAGAMLAGAACMYEVLARRPGGWAYRAGAAIAVLAGLTLTWANLAVGMIGNEGDPANWMFAGVLAIAVGGAAAAGLRAGGMARVMAATAAAQAGVAGAALAFRLGAAAAAWPVDVLAGGAMWTAAWLAAAALFARAGRASVPE